MPRERFARYVAMVEWLVLLPSTLRSARRVVMCLSSLIFLKMFIVHLHILVVWSRKKSCL